MSLKEQLAKELAEGKEIKLTASDLAAGRIHTAPEPTDTPVNPAPANGPVEVVASQAPDRDPLIRGSALGDTGKSMAATMNATTAKELAATDLSGARLLATKVTIDPGIKAAFIDAMISGKRFKVPFSLFGGKVEGVFRSRSQIETLAIIGRINREIADKTVVTGLDYATRLRNMLLTAQIETLSSEAYPEMRAPLMATVEGTDKTVPPGWLGQVAIWESKPEGLVSALYHKLVTFEQQYWTMVDNAGDQNFWSPVGST